MNIEKRIKKLNLVLVDLDDVRFEREPFSYLSQSSVCVGPAFISCFLEDKDTHLSYQHFCDAFHNTLGLFLSQLKLSIGSDWNKLIGPNSIKIQLSTALSEDRFDEFYTYVMKTLDELFVDVEQSFVIDLYGVVRLPQNSLISVSGVFQIRDE